MIELNSDVMRLISEFLGPVDCARMAKVSKGWKTYIYRSQVWNRFNWRITTEPIVLGITDKSVHCAEKRKDCFWNWVSRTYSFRNGGVLQLDILWRLWKQQGQPCRILFHYLPETCFLYNLDAAEKNHFLKNHIVYGQSGPSLTNPYHHYLERISRSVWSANGGQISAYWFADQNKLKNRLISLEELKTSSAKFECKLIAIDLCHLQKIIDEFTRLFNVFQGNLHLLQEISDEQFRKNHIIINNHNNLAWNNIIFEVGHIRLPIYL